MNPSQDFEKNFEPKTDPDLTSDLQSDIQGEVDFEKPLESNTNNAEPTSMPAPENKTVNDVTPKSPSVPEQNYTPPANNQSPDIGIPEAPAPKKRTWLWVILGIILFLILGLGGAALASYKGWLNIGLGEYFGGISGNPYKALYQVTSQTTDMDEFEYSSEINLSTRTNTESDISGTQTRQSSVTATIISTVQKVLDFPQIAKFFFLALILK